MRFCESHWDMVREACSDRGMDHLVHKDGYSAAEAMAKEIEGTNTIQDWDPLMAATWNLFGVIGDKVGLQAFIDPDFCPLCAVQESYDTYMSADPKPEFPPGAVALDAQGWVNSCMDAMLAYAREKGLMPQVQ